MRGDDDPKTTSAPAEKISIKGKLGNLMRAASFGRKARPLVPKPDAAVTVVDAAKDGGAAAAASQPLSPQRVEARRADQVGEGSSSRRVDDSSSPKPGTRTAPASEVVPRRFVPAMLPPLAPLGAVLLKKHRKHKLGRQWGKRWVEVDDYRGLFCYYATSSKLTAKDPAAKGTFSVPLEQIVGLAVSHNELNVGTATRELDADGPYALRVTSAQAGSIVFRLPNQATFVAWTEGLFARCNALVAIRDKRDGVVRVAAAADNDDDDGDGDGDDGGDEDGGDGDGDGDGAVGLSTATTPVAIQAGPRFGVADSSARSSYDATNSADATDAPTPRDRADGGADADASPPLATPLAVEAPAKRVEHSGGAELACAQPVAPADAPARQHAARPPPAPAPQQETAPAPTPTPPPTAARSAPQPADVDGVDELELEVEELWLAPAPPVLARVDSVSHSSIQRPRLPSVDNAGYYLGDNVVSPQRSPPQVAAAAAKGSAALALSAKLAAALDAEDSHPASPVPPDESARASDETETETVAVERRRAAAAAAPPVEPLHAPSPLRPPPAAAQPPTAAKGLHIGQGIAADANFASEDWDSD